MAHSVQWYLRRKGLPECPKKAASDAAVWAAKARSTSKRRIRLEHTIDVFSRCVAANQCPGQFLADEIILCLNELKELRNPTQGQP